MITERARVVDARGEWAWVEQLQASSCSTCDSGAGCGIASIAKLFSRHIKPLQAVNSIDARPGDEVTIGISESALLKGSVAVYLQPLILMFLFAFAADYLALQFELGYRDLVTTIAGAAGLGMGIFQIRRFSMQAKANQDYQVHILEACSSVLPIQEPQ